MAEFQFRTVVLALGCASLLVVAGGTVAAQAVARPAKQPPTPWISTAAARGLVRVPRASVVVGEAEPNGTTATATLVAIGDQATGAISPAADIDFYAIDLAANTVVNIEVFAEREGSALDPVIALFAPNGVTLLAENDDTFGFDSRIRISVTATGRHFLRIMDFAGSGGAQFTYRIVFNLAAAAPGDPTTLVGAGLGLAFGLAAGPGVFYAADLNGRLLRVPAAGGQVTTLATGLAAPFQVVVDGRGDLLVTELGTENTASRVSRITAGGTQSVFATGMEFASGITIGPDGDVWVVDASAAAARLIRFDASGQQKSSTPITGIDLFGFAAIAFSPTGQLHLSNFDGGLYRLANGVWTLVLPLNGMGAFAFDRDGFVYVGTPFDGLHLYNAAYLPVSVPFVLVGASAASHVAFGRAASGAVNAQLVVLAFNEGELRQANPASVRAAGFRIGVDLLDVTTTTLAPGTMGADYSQTLQVANPPGPVAWSIAAGTLPPGLALAATTGVLSGVAEQSGPFAFTVRATSGAQTGTRELTLTIDRPTVVVAGAANHLLGQTGQLTPALERFLDLQGNRNGRFDLGDLQAYVRAQGQVP